ncbi:iron-containing alcohol dehydrogenase [Syntrophotalea acetylenica]|uniref:L-threonine dehydrogenase n=1 Tax=Syntrophotalea acetylenica TaxID=29542 RepID=A0A1L3GDB5_SYNAC|nr:iron-containing alcohol dehydrogenase [Syntrophotalea acetylenica]APG23940.1 L-threonine dehydrogenase [Syntrophotalea acetylenica]APG44521.1 L-threonine dehydrogenase [Syntrophotalea acetylenica]
MALSREFVKQVYTFFTPPVALMGAGAVEQVGEEAKKLGATKVLLVTDPGMSKIGVAARIIELIEKAGVEVVLFDGAQPNPTYGNVSEGVKAYKDNNCDGLISLGGGSSHDTCKGVGIVISQDGDLSDYIFPAVLTKPFPPYISINTTAGTASEMTRYAVITDESIHVKKVFGDANMLPNVAINDPLMHRGMPAGLTAATGMDALTHAIEGLLTELTTPVTDACGFEAVRLIAKWLRKAVANGQDMAAREAMAYAEYLAGLCFGNAGLGCVHSMAHQPGSMLNLPHGVCNAIALPVVCEYNLMARLERFGEIAIAMGEDISGLSPKAAALKAIEAIRTLSADIGIPSGYAAIGIKESDIQKLAENAYNDFCTFFNPRDITVDILIDLYKKAM